VVFYIELHGVINNYIMRRLVFIISLLTINISCLYSQEQQRILSNALQSYQKELPNLQKTIFKKLCKLYKQSNIHKNDFDKYQIIVIPTFKLNANFAQYKEGEIFAKYIDFKKMRNGYEGYIFKNSSYIGNLFIDKSWSYFNPSIHKDLAKQIRDFKPDMVFYPDCWIFLCCIKDGKFYLSEMKDTSNCIFLPEDEFMKKYPSFIEGLRMYKFYALKHYKELQ